MTSLVLKVPKLAFASKQRLYIRNQKELKLLVAKNLNCDPFR